MLLYEYLLSLVRTVSKVNEILYHVIRARVRARKHVRKPLIISPGCYAAADRSINP